MGNILEDNLPDDKPDDPCKRGLYGYRLLYDGFERGNDVYREHLPRGERKRCQLGNGMDVRLDRNSDNCGGSGSILSIRILPEKRLRKEET